MRRHGHVYIEDLGSLTGVRVNGQRIHGRRPVHEGDLIEISRYDLILESGPGDAALEKPPEEVTTPIVHDAGSRADAREEATRRVVRVATIVLVVAACVAARTTGALAAGTHTHAHRVAVQRARVVRFARRFLGVRYVYGGTSPRSG